MTQCDVCGNDYDKAFRVVGHGAGIDDEIHCGAHCATEAGASGVRDRV